MIQLIFSKLKKLKIAIGLFLLIFFVSAGIIAVPKNALASTYGEGVYGACPYETGCNEDGSPVIPSSTPTTSETNLNSSSSTDSSGELTTLNPTATDSNTSSTPTFSISDPSTGETTSLSTDSTTTFTTQYPTLQGHTLPYATVTIEISPSFKIDVIADANGDWKYKVTDPLDFGEHTIKITIKEKDTDKLISEGTYKINITEKTEAKDNDTASPKSHRTLIIIGIIALSLIAIILLFLLIARSRRKKHQNY